MRNAIISILIAICLPYLPIWQWDGTGDRIGSAAVFFLIALAVLTVTEKGGEHGQRNTDYKSKTLKSGE